MAHRVLADVHTRQAEQEGGHGLGSCGRRRWHRREERSTPRERGCAPPVNEEPEVPDADEAGRENVEEEAGQELGRREGLSLQAVPVRGVPPPEAHNALGQAHQAVVGDRHAVGVAAEVLEDLGRPGDRRLGFVVSSAERCPRPSREHGAGGASRGLRHMRITRTQ
jgi:hypothetical protein